MKITVMGGKYKADSVVSSVQQLGGKVLSTKKEGPFIVVRASDVDKATLKARLAAACITVSIVED